jgi:hypothetical protein
LDSSRKMNADGIIGKSSVLAEILDSFRITFLNF